MKSILPLAAVVAAGAVAAAFADGPADNVPDKVRPVPPPGVAVPDAERAALEQGLSELGRAVDGIRGNAKTAALAPDVEIYHKAVRYALQNNEFFNVNEIARAKSLLAQGLERAKQISSGQMTYLTTPGLKALGYVSAIDGSVQPYGLLVPDTYAPGPQRYRLDNWYHGRGETLSEVNFIDGVQRSGGPFTRPDTFVLQLYGRYCNANKLAGEVDQFEALADVKRRYRIDPDRITIRGFSMGGAACWQFAAHYASEWAAAAPGAGFSETPLFLKVFQSETLKPTWWEQKLWQMYDCPEYTANFFNVPLVAYSGEIDSQKQAADVMEKVLMANEGIRMTHIIGPKTAHAYHPQSRVEIDRLVDTIVEKGRVRVPQMVKLNTPTLKYNKQAWVVVDALGKHWEKSRVDAEIVDDHTVTAKTSNITALTFSMPAGYCPLEAGRTLNVTLDGDKLQAPGVASDRSWTVHFRKSGNRWTVANTPETGLVKKHDLQGPIDDAFMQSFLIVRPTGKPAAPGITKWVDSELQHAITEWRRQFRGDARIKNDSDVTDADIAAHNLVLWGDPGSNAIFAKIADKLPIRWSGDQVMVGKKSYSAATHAPILIYPNPLNPEKYVVINSGFTYREYDYLNNARQVPRLPDWAIVDTTTPPNSKYPGKVVDANFFGERWELVEENRK